MGKATQNFVKVVTVIHGHGQDLNFAHLSL